VAAGFAVVQVTYADANGPQALRDIGAFYNAAKAKYPDEKVCMVGQSAGAQLALMTTLLYNLPACVVSEGAATDLNASYFSPDVKKAIAVAWGSDPATRSFYSPLTHAAHSGGRFFLAAAQNDMVVWNKQSTDMASAGRSPYDMVETTVCLAQRVWVHTYDACKPGVEEFYAKALAFITEKTT
jgi:dipeptidyl aminopeptidase/acylaminoacyl peptidase